MSFYCENTNKVWYENLWNWLCKWNFIFDLLTSTQGHQFDLRVTFCSVHHPRQFDVPHDHAQKKELTPGLPRHSQVSPLGHDPGIRTKIPFGMFHNLLFIRTPTKFRINFWKKLPLPPPQGPRGQAKDFFAVARPIHVSNSHTKFGWISSNG